MNNKEAAEILTKQIGRLSEEQERLTGTALSARPTWGSLIDSMEACRLGAKALEEVERLREAVRIADECVGREHAHVVEAQQRIAELEKEVQQLRTAASR